MDGKRNSYSTLGDLKLLAVANGREHPDAACIVDVELMPELPPEHPQFSRRMETRSRTIAQNEASSLEPSARRRDLGARVRGSDCHSYTCFDTADQGLRIALRRAASYDQVPRPDWM